MKQKMISSAPLTKDDLIQAFATFEKSFEKKMDMKLFELEKNMDMKLDTLETRIDAKFTDFEKRIEIKIDNIRNKRPNYRDNIYVLRDECKKGKNK